MQKKRKLQLLKDFQSGVAQKAARGNGGGGALAILDKQKAGGMGAGKGGGKGKGKGGGLDPRFPTNAMQKTKDDELICINWNKGACTYPKCRFVHVCWFCGDATHTGPEHEAKQA